MVLVSVFNHVYNIISCDCSVDCLVHWTYNVMFVRFSVVVLPKKWIARSYLFSLPLCSENKTVDPQRNTMVWFISLLSFYVIVTPFKSRASGVKHVYLVDNATIQVSPSHEYFAIVGPIIVGRLIVGLVVRVQCCTFRAFDLRGSRTRSRTRGRRRLISGREVC